MCQLKTAFVSGHIDATRAYFTKYYVPSLEQAIKDGHRFVMSHAKGIDTMALEYLLSKGVAAGHIDIYLHRGQEALLRGSLGYFKTLGGRVIIAGSTHTQRDEACTRASHYDILRYRTIQEMKDLYKARYRERVSGTEKNELRRKSGIGLVWVDEGGS